MIATMMVVMMMTVDENVCAAEVRVKNVHKTKKNVMITARSHTRINNVQLNHLCHSFFLGSAPV